MAGGEGASLGRYQLGRYLGRGGMGEVYLARAVGPAGFEKRVAIKILPERHVRDTERSRRLLWEALVSCQLDHTNIVSVLDAGEDDGRPFVVMEYVRGHSLSTLLESLRSAGELLPVHSALFIARAVGRALDYVHTLPSSDGGPRGLIHGDVSPSNVLLGVDGRVKLGDFGVASTADDRDRDEHIAGKLAYLPPEAFAGRPPLPSWDVYALACTLYEMLAGVAPFEGDGFAEHQRALADGARPLLDRRGGCPAAVGAIVDRAIARDATVRYATAAELISALDDAVPCLGGDVARHCRFIDEVFRRDAFIARHGELPEKGSISTRFARVPPRELEITPTTPSALIPPLRFGLSPALGAELARSYGADLATYLGERLGRTVLTTVFADYHTLSEAVISGAVDVGWTPPMELLSVVRSGGGALVGAQRRGRASYESAILVRDDSPYRELTDLRGCSFAWVDRRSSSGYLVARAMLGDAFDTDEPPLGREHFHGSHRAVCEAVLHGWADAGATYAASAADGSFVSAAWIDVLGERAGELRAVAVSAPIPSDGIAHRPGLPMSDRAALRTILVEMVEDVTGRELLSRIFNADAFAEASVDDGVEDRAQKLGVGPAVRR